MLQHAEKRVGVWYHSYGNFLRPWLSLKLSGRCFGVSLHNADRLHWTKIILSKLRNYNHLSALNTGLCLCWWAHKIWIESNTWHGTFPDLHSVLSKPAEQLESFQVKGKNVWLSVKADKMPSKDRLLIPIKKTLVWVNLGETTATVWCWSDLSGLNFWHITSASRFTCGQSCWGSREEEEKWEMGNEISLEDEIIPVS